MSNRHSGPLVSVIVPTRNSSAYLARCLTSIRAQTYRSIEIIVVDNSSGDNTIDIATLFADAIVIAGPERSAQVNAGVAAAAGRYVYRVDSDFELDVGVISDCVAICEGGFDAVVVHNSPDESVGLLARIRKFETDMYKYSVAHSAARFVRRDIYIRVGGLREDVTAGEDYDFQNRLNQLGVRTGFVDREAIHLGEPVNLAVALRKYYWYGQDFVKFLGHNGALGAKQLGLVRGEYIRHWRKFVAHPVLGSLFVVYDVLKFGAGACGLIVGVARLTGRARKVKLGVPRGSRDCGARSVAGLRGWLSLVRSKRGCPYGFVKRLCGDFSAPGSCRGSQCGACRELRRSGGVRDR